MRYALNNNEGVPPTKGTEIKLDTSSPWKDILHEFIAFTHAEGTWAEVTRYTVSTDVYTRYDKGFEDKKTISYIANDAQAAMGFRIDVDALYIKVATLDFENLTKNKHWPPLYQQLNARYFRHKLSQVLPGLSKFELDWIWQVELSLIIERATTLSISLQEAVDVVHDVDNRFEFTKKNLHLIFDNSTIADEADKSEEQSHLKEKIFSLLVDPDIMQHLRNAASCLWDATDPDLEIWIRDVYMHSVGAAVYSAIIAMIPEVAEDDLHLDVEKDGFWISELTAGGIGLISRIAAKIQDAPHRFDAFLQHTINYCEREHLASQLDQLADITKEPQIIECFRKIRLTKDLHHVEELQKDLSETLGQFGIAPTRNLLVSINTRFLRPNSNKDTDELIQMLIEFWHEQQNRLGCEIDIRIIAAAAAQDQTIQEKVSEVFSRMKEDHKVVDNAQIFNILQSILWLNCHDSCPDCLEKRHMFQSGEKASRHLLLAIANFGIEAIIYSAPNWKKDTIVKLVENYRVVIECQQDQIFSLRTHLLKWMSEPVDIGYLSLYPDITRINSRADKIYIEISLSDLMESN